MIPTNNLSSTHCVNALADLISLGDQKLIPGRLLEMLSEIDGDTNFSLYQVLSPEPRLTFGLVAYSTRDKIVGIEQPEAETLADDIGAAVTRSVRSGQVEYVDTPDLTSEKSIVYPALTRNKEVFAVLVEKTTEIKPGLKNLILGFLRVYSNFYHTLDQARRDKLTALLNRETLEQEISQVLTLINRKEPFHTQTDPVVKDNKRQTKRGMSYWLGVLDIDHFKLINDTLGHLYGDEVLILVARLMEKCVRKYDLIFRYGGEEFVILIKSSDVHEAKHVFDRIRKAIERHHYAKVKRVTVSIGVTQIANQTGPSEAFSEADTALYFAKSHGRNRVCMYKELIRKKLIKSKEEIEPGGVSYF
ncbi:MAG: GGDEF domain-containing protein [Candidatus Thiodiazotropha sp.]